MYLEDKAPGEGPSISGFLEFTKDQCPTVKYQWDNSHICACARYAKKIGQVDGWRNRSYSTDTVWGWLNSIASHQPHTYGALTKRLKEFA
jgi:hypothetical protein